MGTSRILRLNLKQEASAKVIFIEGHTGTHWEILARVDGPNFYKEAHVELHKLNREILARRAGAHALNPAGPSVGASGRPALPGPGQK